MIGKDNQKKRNVQRHIVTEVANILEELASALVMALLIIGFVVQPFIIPTGSMAETLNGAHFRLRCPQCGYKYDCNFEPAEYGLRANRVPTGAVVPPVSRCPSCGYYNASGKPVVVSKGDKILALKCLYQFFEPKRWDVVVFKNPLDPTINYIKRLVGKPGETVEIIDGDVYIDGKITRKPRKVQQELWMPVYNNDYRPVKAYETRFNDHSWEIPLKNYGDSKWKPSETESGNFYLDGAGIRENRLVYDTSMGNDFHAAYAYNHLEGQGYQPVCSDLKVCFDAVFEANHSVVVGVGLRKYQRYYKARINSDGKMSILRVEQNNEQVLTSMQVQPPVSGDKARAAFANVDHLLIFEWDERELVYDLGPLPGDAGPKRREAEPEVEIIGAGKLSISRIKIYRDIYYTSVNPHNGRKDGNAVEGSPFTLGEDEFFVLGDNSPASLDGRWWNKPGRGNGYEQYRVGTVPRDYLLGKAVFVFWPSGFRPSDKFPIACVPNAGKIRLIYGGSRYVLDAVSEP
ncbi:MAG: signal peptidase I [Phycisphaerales bacterium]|jgi:signal peptidase I